MTQPSQVTDTKRCIVLPFQSEKCKELEGVGLTLHFLLGNVLVLNSNLQEFWFGWRAARIFSDLAMFEAYCEGQDHILSVQELSLQQNIRFWISGSCLQSAVRMQLFDALAPEKIIKREVPYSAEDQLIGFRSAFLDWFEQNTGLPFPKSRRSAALWPEKINGSGWKSVGQALMEFYRFSFADGASSIELHAFAEAVRSSPDSFMAHDLLGWALFRNLDLAAAETSFQRALQINAFGAGAMAGLMWCSLKAGDRDRCVYWAGRKAEACGQDVAAAQEKARQRFSKK